jgi:hypothetical protein
VSLVGLVALFHSNRVAAEVQVFSLQSFALHFLACFLACCLPDLLVGFLTRLLPNVLSFLVLLVFTCLFISACLLCIAAACIDF